MNCRSILPTLLLASTALVLAAVPGTSTGQDAPILQPFQAEYEVLRNDRILGSSRMELRVDGHQWRYTSDTSGDRGMASLIGLRIEQDLTFQWRDGLPQPLASNYSQKASLSSRTVQVHYDWQQRRYQLTDRKGTHEHALPDSTVDRYGSGIAVAARVAAGERDFDLAVAHADGVREWRFRVVGTEAVTTADGQVDAVKVERIRTDSDRSTISWHDPQRGHVAVRMLQVEDGDRIESRLIRYQAL